MKDSRLTEIDLQKASANAGGMYNLVIGASALARSIKINNRHSGRHEHIHAGVTALKEIQDGKRK